MSKLIYPTEQQSEILKKRRHTTKQLKIDDKLLEAWHLLKSVEWVPDCPICKCTKNYGHDKNCKLNHFISKLK